MEMGGGKSHIGDGALQKISELGLLFLGEVFNHLTFRLLDDLIDGFITFDTLGKHVDPFTAAVLFVGTEFDEALLLQPGQKSGNGGVGQLEYFFNIPGAGCLLAVGKITHDTSLGRGQVHFLQRPGDGLGRAGMENAEQGAIMCLQRNHLQYVSQATYILTYAVDLSRA